VGLFGNENLNLHTIFCMNTGKVKADSLIDIVVKQLT